MKNVQNKNLNVGRPTQLTLAEGRGAHQLMQPIRLPLPPQQPSSLCKHFKVLPSADGNKANELAVNGLRRSRYGKAGAAGGGDASNGSHHTGGGAHAISSVAAVRRSRRAPGTTTAEEEELEKGANARANSRGRTFALMGNGADGDVHKRGNLHYRPSFDAMSWQKGAISQREARKWSRQNAQTHRR